MSDLFKEVDEEMRKHKLLAFWKRYRWYILIVAILLVLQGGGFLLWRLHVAKLREAASSVYGQALTLMHDQKESQASQLLRTLTPKTTTYGLLARLHLASLLLKKGQIKKAYDLYQEASTLHGPSTLKSFAAVMALMYSPEKGASLFRTIDSLLATHTPWRFFLLNVAAHKALEQKRPQKAKAYLQQLIKDPLAPPSLVAEAKTLKRMVAQEAVH